MRNFSVALVCLRAPYILLFLLFLRNAKGIYPILQVFILRECKMEDSNTVRGQFTGNRSVCVGRTLYSFVSGLHYGEI